MVLPSQMTYVGRSKSKVVLPEQIDQAVGHVVAGNEFHVDLEAVMVVARLA